MFQVRHPDRASCRHEVRGTPGRRRRTGECAVVVVVLRTGHGEDATNAGRSAASVIVPHLLVHGLPRARAPGSSAPDGGGLPTRNGAARPEPDGRPSDPSGDDDHEHHPVRGARSRCPALPLDEAGRSCPRGRGSRHAAAARPRGVGSPARRHRADVGHRAVAAVPGGRPTAPPRESGRGTQRHRRSASRRVAGLDRRRGRRGGAVGACGRGGGRGGLRGRRPPPRSRDRVRPAGRGRHRGGVPRGHPGVRHRASEQRGLSTPAGAHRSVAPARGRPARRRRRARAPLPGARGPGRGCCPWR